MADDNNTAFIVGGLAALVIGVGYILARKTTAAAPRTTGPKLAAVGLPTIR